MMRGGTRPTRIVDRAGAADADLVGMLMARHGEDVRRLTRLYVGVQDADDAAQEVWLAVVRKLWQLEDEERAGPWLRVLTFHRCIDFRRTRARRRQAEVALGEEDWRRLAAYVAGEDADPADLLERQQLRCLVREHLDRMRPIFGVMLRLRYLDGLTQAEIAELTGVPVGTVKWRLHHARQMLLASLAAVIRGPSGLSKERRDER